MEIEGFFEITAKAQAGQPVLDGIPRIGRHDDDGRAGVSFLDFPQHLVPVHAGHVQVRQHDVELAGPQHLKGLFSGTRGEDLQPL